MKKEKCNISLMTRGQRERIRAGVLVPPVTDYIYIRPVWSSAEIKQCRNINMRWKNNEKRKRGVREGDKDRGIA